MTFPSAEIVNEYIGPVPKPPILCKVINVSAGIGSGEEDCVRLAVILSNDLLCRIVEKALTACAGFPSSLMLAAALSGLLVLVHKLVESSRESPCAYTKYSTPTLKTKSQPVGAVSWYKLFSCA